MMRISSKKSKGVFNKLTYLSLLTVAQRAKVSNGDICLSVCAIVHVKLVSCGTLSFDDLVTLENTF